MCLKTKQTTLKKKQPKKYLKKNLMAKKLKSNFINFILSNMSNLQLNKLRFRPIQKKQVPTKSELQL